MSGALARVVPAPGPIRALALITLVNTAGRGIFFTLSALYFTRILGFTPVQVGGALSIGALFGIAAGIPLGHLGDRRGAREVMAALLVLETVFAGLLLLVGQWWQLLVVASAYTFVDRGANACRGALIAGLVTGERRAGTRAYLRSVTNVGMAVGTAIAAIALHLDTAAAYRAVLFVDVATYAVCALLALRLDRIAPTSPERAASMFLAARDLPFVAVTVVGGLLGVQYWIVEIAMPLWVVDHTDAPRYLVAVLSMVNMVVVIGGQVAVARRVATVDTAVRATVASGAFFLLACAVFGLSAHVAAAGAVGLLLLAALLHVGGEMLQSSGSFALGYDLAPDHAQGQYQGLYGMGMALSSFLAPTVMTTLPLGLGLLGWCLLGGGLLAASLLMVPAVAWASRTRATYAAQVPADATT